MESRRWCGGLKVLIHWHDEGDHYTDSDKAQTSACVLAHPIYHYVLPTFSFIFSVLSSDSSGHLIRDLESFNHCPINVFSKSFLFMTGRVKHFTLLLFSIAASLRIFISSSYLSLVFRGKLWMPLTQCLVSTTYIRDFLPSVYSELLQRHLKYLILQLCMLLTVMRWPFALQRRLSLSALSSVCSWTKAGSLPNSKSREVPGQSSFSYNGQTVTSSSAELSDSRGW